MNKIRFRLEELFLNNLKINCIVSSTYVANKNILYLFYKTPKKKKSWFLLDCEINFTSFSIIDGMKYVTLKIMKKLILNILNSLNMLSFY